MKVKTVCLTYIKSFVSALENRGGYLSYKFQELRSNQVFSTFQSLFTKGSAFFVYLKLISNIL